MQTLNSFKGYGKVDPVEEEAFSRVRRRRAAILAISSAVLIAVVVGAVVGAALSKNDKDSASHSESPSSTVKALCSVTQYPAACYSSISSANAANTTDPDALFKLSLKVAQSSLLHLKDLPTKLASSGVHSNLLTSALNVCTTVFDDAVEAINDTLSSGVAPPSAADLATWLSSVITNIHTCFDSVEESRNVTVLHRLQTATENATQFASNSLAIVTKLLNVVSSNNRKLLGYPAWVSAGDRRLLQSAKPNPNVTVAADGSGNVTTISKAVSMIPSKSETRFIIYVKAGVYNERVALPKGAWNVMLCGDGIGKTVVTGASSIADGVTTFDTSTFSVGGKNFIAKDISFVNTAGAANHQAVAFRSGSDMSVYLRCAFDAYQDTLYSHSNRQFYVNCLITGTIDFIFGNAAVVFQNCDIRPRQPMASQFNTITAQGKVDRNQNTGISIQKCRISGNGPVTASTFLGRPWKNFSTTVVMQTEIGPVMSSAGWVPWVVGTDPPKTIFYGEYQNSGAGASISNRVKWAGYFPALSVVQAVKFTVGSFIQGPSWVPSTAVTYSNGL